MTSTETFKIVPKRSTIAMTKHRKVCEDYEKTIADLNAQIAQLTLLNETLSKRKVPKKRVYKYVEERCYCGAKYNKSTRSRHMKTKKHKDWVKSNPDHHDHSISGEKFKERLAPARHQEVVETDDEGDDTDTQSDSQSDTQSDSDDE